jgi:acetyltransferase-like isoleucine patch superfamily enzyme
MFNYFDKDIPWEIREQILKYNATENMSDVERARFFNLPQGCRIREGAKIIALQNLKIGEFCWIGENALLDASGGLEIGSHVSIGLSVFVWTHESYRLNIKGKNTREYSKDIIRKRTKIGNNCFIAGPSVIMPGVTIGDKCIIGPLSVVYQDLPVRTLYTPYKDFYKISKKMETSFKNKMVDAESEALTERIALLENKIKELESIIKK